MTISPTLFENDLIVQQARKDDLSTIVEIAQTARLDLSKVDKYQIRQGFLVNILDIPGYQNRLNDFFLTLLKNEKIIGYVLGYDETFLQNLIQLGLLVSNKTIEFLLETSKGVSFHFGDQIAILPDYRNRNAGTFLSNHVDDLVRRKNIYHRYVDILHAPVRNRASIQFQKKRGYECVGEVKTANGLVWGIYHLDIPNSID